MSIENEDGPRGTEGERQVKKRSQDDNQIKEWTTRLTTREERRESQKTKENVRT